MDIEGNTPQGGSSDSMTKKVCLLGEFAVGKTSMVRRFVYNRFDDRYISTIGVKVSRKTVVIPQISRDGLITLTMMLWDMAGSVEFNRIRASYLRGAAGAILVCDLTRKETLGKLRHYRDDLHRVCPDAKIILAANKSDLIDQHEFSPEMVREVADDFQSPYYMTSAKEGNEVDSLFRHLGQLLLD